MSLGLSKAKSDENSTLPAALRGALSMSVMIRFTALAGSTAKKTLPASLSYAPTGPKVLPAATSSFFWTSTRTTSAVPGLQSPTSAMTAPSTRRVMSASVLQVASSQQVTPAGLVARVVEQRPAQRVSEAGVDAEEEADVDRVDHCL